MSDELRPEDVELGEELEPVIRSRAPVVAVRMSPELFARLSAYAASHHRTISDVVRDAVESRLEGVTVAPGEIVSTGDFHPSGGYAAATPQAQSSARSIARDVRDESAAETSLTA